MRRWPASRGEYKGCVFVQGQVGQAYVLALDQDHGERAIDNFARTARLLPRTMNLIAILASAIAIISIRGSIIEARIISTG